MLVLAFVLELLEPVNDQRKLVISITSTYSLVIDNNEEKANKAGEGLAEDPLNPDTSAIVDADEGSINLALDCRSILMDLSLLNNTSAMRVS